MNRFKHWFAAALFGTVISVASVLIVAAAIYFIYLVVTNFPFFVLTVAGCGVFVWATHWSESYIREHGWPWKPKHQSEGESHG